MYLSKFFYILKSFIKLSFGRHKFFLSFPPVNYLNLNDQNQFKCIEIFSPWKITSLYTKKMTKFINKYHTLLEATHSTHEICLQQPLTRLRDLIVIKCDTVQFSSCQHQINSNLTLDDTVKKYFCSRRTHLEPNRHNVCETYLI